MDFEFRPIYRNLVDYGSVHFLTGCNGSIKLLFLGHRQSTKAMEDLTAWQALLVVGGFLLALAGAINTIGSAIEKCVKAWKAAKAPEESQNDRLSKVEKDVEDIKRKLKNDADALADNSKANHVTQEALLALLEHGLHGNNVAQMTAAKTNLEKYLINH